jgi:hypothetical protein
MLFARAVISTLSNPTTAAYSSTHSIESMKAHQRSRHDCYPVLFHESLGSVSQAASFQSDVASQVRTTARLRWTVSHEWSIRSCPGPGADALGQNSRAPHPPTPQSLAPTYGIRSRLVCDETQQSSLRLASRNDVCKRNCSKRRIACA